jgi:hypothetical protein
MGICIYMTDTNSTNLGFKIWISGSKVIACRIIDARIQAMKCLPCQMLHSNFQRNKSNLSHLEAGAIITDQGEWRNPFVAIYTRERWGIDNPMSTRPVKPHVPQQGNWRQCKSSEKVNGMIGARSQKVSGS